MLLQLPLSAARTYGNVARVIERSIRAFSVLCAVTFAIAAGAQKPPDPFPDWAYMWDPAFTPAPATDELQHVPDSDGAFSVAQSRDLFFSPDWHPGDHPLMPDIVAHGRKPDVLACGSCHRAEGTGGPENASLAGLSPEYIAQQMADFKSGARRFAGPQRRPVLLMIGVAKAASEADVQSAAAYFSALRPKRNIKVVETDTIPRPHIAGVFFALSKDGGTEPLGRRIVEVPDDVEQFELRDTRSQFTAYVPVGSIKRGQNLVRTGGGRTVPCAPCHGTTFAGAGSNPRIAGRSPAYLVRQLYDFKSGARGGAMSPLMKPTVEKLTVDDMIALAAYLASLP